MLRFQPRSLLASFTHQDRKDTSMTMTSARRIIRGIATPFGIILLIALLAPGLTGLYHHSVTEAAGLDLNPVPTQTSITVQFSQSTATTTETLNAPTKLDLTVIRSGDTSGAVSVNYASADGTANDRSDYLAALGTLRFQPGETTKTISVFILDDSFGEAAESFNVTLSNPVGGSLGALVTTTVTINSNEAVDGPNPVRDASFSSDFFVRQHYVDFFNREADISGLAFWKNQIDECTTQSCREIRRINVSAAFFLSIEFQQTGYLVYKANQAAFNSGEQLALQTFLPDTQEIGRGIVFGQPGADQQLETNKENFFLDFVQRPAFLAAGAYPSTLTATQFVDKLNGNTLDPLNPGSGPALTPGERQALIDQLAMDQTSPSLRAQVLRSVSENTIFTQRQFNKAFVLMQYFGYLRRNPNATPDTNFDGYNFWLGKLNQFNGNFVSAEMVKAFITSGEYLQRFGPPSIPTPTPTPGITIVIEKPWIFFPAIGASTQLTAQILDAQGNPSPGSVTWTSTATDKVSVDATGRVTALAIGSTQIIAESAGVRSAPTLVIVAQPKPGALLVTDTQVVSVGPPVGLPPGAPPGVGTQYEVMLRGVAAPSPGTVMLAAETAPIAGKVIATRPDAGDLIVTLALAPLYELFSNYEIVWTIDLSAFPLEAVPVQSAASTLSARWHAERHGSSRPLAKKRSSAELEPFKAFDCDAEIKPQLLSAPIELSPEVNLKLVVMDQPGYSKHALEGSATLTGRAGLKLKAGFKASGKCEAKAQFKLPVFGAASVIVMPAVNFGLGAELEGEIRLVQGELGVEGKVGFSPVAGWECGGSSPDCRGLDDIREVNEFKTKSKIPSENDMQAKVSAQFYILAGLDLAILAGLGNAEILEAKIGPQQSFDLAFEEDQAARADYASSYDLKLAGVVEPGAALKKAIEMVIGDDTTGVSFKAEFSSDISESPKGSHSVNKTRVRPGERVDFTVDLLADTVAYFLLGYNVTGVELYRKRDDELEFTPWKSMSLIASNRATYQWTPTIADAGNYDFAAFVNTQIPVPLLEIAPNSIQKVEVSCFSSSPDSLFGSKTTRFVTRAGIGTQVPTCADTWVGTASSGDDVYGPNQSQSILTLKVDTRIDTGDPAIVAYYAEGTVNIRNLGLEQLGCTLTPTQFTFDRETGTPAPGREGEANQFLVDYTRVPATFSGAGFVRVTQTVMCPSYTSPREELFLYRFFRGDREVALSADGLTIQDSSLPFYSFQLTRP
jgi:hypothetical protein